MAGFKLIYTVFAAIIFVVVVVFSYSFTASSIQEVGVKMMNSSQELEVIDVPHIIERCFKGENDSISANFLDEKVSMGEDVCGICKICITRVMAKLTDLETDKEWTFGEAEKDYFHSIFVSIKVNEKIHVGRLYVQMEKI